MPSRKIKIQSCVLTILFIILTGNSVLSAFGAQTQARNLFVTITTPAPTDPFAMGSDTDIILYPETETLPVRAVAQPNKLINLYSWSIIPGTDQNTKTNEVMSDFNAEVVPNGVRLTWNPRTIFRQDYADNELTTAEGSCTVLQLTGVVPSGVTCREDPADMKYSVYDDIVKPEGGKALLNFDPPENEQTLAEVFNSPAFTDPQCDDNGCGGCEYEYHPTGWTHTGGVIPVTLPNGTEGPIPLLNEDLSVLDYSFFAVDEVNGFVHSIDGPGNPWETRLILPNIYAPNITLNRYSGAYVFSYHNYVRAYNENVTCTSDPDDIISYEAHEFHPIRDRLFLFDGFEQYEIYAVAKDEYETQKGVTRENGQLAAVVRDPSVGEIEIEYAASGLDPSQSYIFTIFEVRDSEQVNLPSSLTDTLTAKSAPCSGDPDDTVTVCNAVQGHLISTRDEIEVDISNNAVTPIPSPQKLQWQIFEQEGGYTTDALVSDRNGELKCGVNRDQECLIEKSVMNRFADYHFIFGTYLSDNTILGSDTGTTFSIRSNRAVGSSFSPYNISGKTAAVRPSENLYGVVFNAWTHEVLGNVTLEMNGTSAKRQEPVRSVQLLDSDGLFTFPVEPGEYSLSILNIDGVGNTFLFPHPDSTTSCTNGGIFSDLYCDSAEVITVGSDISHRDISVLPTVQGEISGTTDPVRIVLKQAGSGAEIATTWSLPNGNFSFLVAPGNYVISEVVHQNGTVIASPDASISIPSDATGRPISPANISLVL